MTAFPAATVSAPPTGPEHARARGVDGWPAADTPVLANRPLRPGADPTPTRFGDQVWRLDPAHPDAHADLDPIHWARFPPRLTPAFKTFALAALDHPFPAQAPARTHVDRPAVSTIINWISYLRLFAAWTHQRGVARLPDLTGRDLDAYRDHVLASAAAAKRKAALLGAVRTLWSYRALLPADCQIACDPFGGATGNHLAGRPSADRVNKTPRIAAATMEALLGWALRMVEDIGPDIVAAWQEHRQLDDGNHPSQAALAGLNPTQRIEWFVRHARSTGAALPGHAGTTPPAVNYSHLSRMLGIKHASGAPTWPPRWRKIIAEAGLPVASGSHLGAITARVDGRPWRDHPITTTELPTLLRALSAAAFVTTCYLSGMRPGEALNLHRGCADIDQATGELLVRGRPGKGHDREPSTSTDPEPDRPWVVVQPVHTAITLLESITPHPLLFPASITKPHRDRPAADHARTNEAINTDIEAFIDWVNTTFTGPTGTPPIPPDPTKRVHASRFRRSLAYFIVRRPRGLLAAALQYGHVHSKVTLSYSGAADTSWLDDLAVERLEMLLEQGADDWTRLHHGEHVSGPSAHEYRRRVANTARFAGRTVSQVRNAERLLAQAPPAVHHGEAMTCVWRQETAACRNAKLDQGLPADDFPDEAECRTACPNRAYTDRDIDQQREHLDILRRHATDPLAPIPRRDRAAAQATQIQTIIDHHEQTRPAHRAGTSEPTSQGARR